MTMKFLRENTIILVSSYSYPYHSCYFQLFSIIQSTPIVHQLLWSVHLARKSTSPPVVGSTTTPPASLMIFNIDDQNHNNDCHQNRRHCLNKYMESIFEIVPDSSQTDKIQHNPRKKQTTLSPLTSSFCSKHLTRRQGPA